MTSGYSLETPSEVDESAFLETFPGYATTRRLDELRAAEFERLDAEHHAYLDYTGGSLYAISQVRRHLDLLGRSVFGNPHSTNPSSVVSTDLLESTRRDVLEYFNAPESDHVLVFTANASHSLKLVGESYPFEAGDNFLLTFDNHNSVNGIREFDRVRGARTTYVPLNGDMRVLDETIDSFLRMASPHHNNLFAFPAQSNFSGVQHPLEWIERARSHGWDVLLDAAAFVPTNPLDVGRWKPDFVALSFYKMFGYPTGVGALIARREAMSKLHRPWFAGGTITVASVQADQYVMAQGAAAFEDGTPNYLSIPAVRFGLDVIRSVGIDTIHERVRCLTGWLIRRLLEIHHDNGAPLVRIYGPHDTEKRGGTVTLNFYDHLGQVIDHDEVERRANGMMISLRTGCFCNPGAGESALGLSKDELDTCFARAPGRLTYDDFRRCIDDKSTGAVRVSFGLASNLSDVDRFIELATSFAAR